MNITRTTLLLSLPVLLMAKAPSAPLKASLVQGLHFGGVRLDPMGGQLNLTPDGTLLPERGNLSVWAPPLARDARFRVTGPPGAKLKVEFDPPRPILSGSNGGTLQVETFQTLPMDGLLTLDSQGEAEIRVGAKLDVPGGAPAGTYTSSAARLKLRLADGADRDPAPASEPIPLCVVLKAPLRIENNQSLSFGGLIPNTGGGALEVMPDGTFRTIGPGAPSMVKERPSAATFFMQGEPGTAFNISLPTEVFLKGPGAPLRVDGFTSSIPSTGLLPPNGITFGVGARLNLPEKQPHGMYTGQFVVTVSYN